MKRDHSQAVQLQPPSTDTSFENKLRVRIWPNAFICARNCGQRLVSLALVVWSLVSECANVREKILINVGGLNCSRRWQPFFVLRLASDAIVDDSIAHSLCKLIWFYCVVAATPLTRQLPHLFSTHTQQVSLFTLCVLSSSFRRSIVAGRLQNTFDSRRHTRVRFPGIAIVDHGISQRRKNGVRDYFYINAIRCRIVAISVFSSSFFFFIYSDAQTDTKHSSHAATLDLRRIERQALETKKRLFLFSYRAMILNSYELSTSLNRRGHWNSHWIVTENLKIKRTLGDGKCAIFIHADRSSCFRCRLEIASRKCLLA